MRTIRTAKSIPKHWTGHPSAIDLVAEADIALSSRSRLRVKLLVFRSMKALHRFWKDALDGDIPDAVGACHTLGSTIIEILPNGGGERTRREVDPRYVCVVGLVLGRLNFEVISHEAVHAGFAVANRALRCRLDGMDEMEVEEAVCYPAGRVGAAINRFLHRKGLYPR